MRGTESTVIPLLNKEVETEVLLKQRHTKEYYDAAVVADPYLEPQDNLRVVLGFKVQEDDLNVRS